MSDDNKTPENEISPEEMESAAEQAAEEAPDDPLARLEKENAELRDRTLRALAEAENARKRAERDIESARTYAIERFAADLLAVADNLNRALDALPEGAREEGPESIRTLASGVELTKKELIKSFEKHGVTREDPLGEPFDPNRHQAVAQIPSDQPAGRVAEVMQAGYRMGDRILRAAMVAVSTGPAKGEAESGGGDAGQGESPGGQTDIKV